MYLTGGVDCPISPAAMKGYTLLRALTLSWNDQPERASRPFSADRDGFVLAEGSWMFVLEDYDHAHARGAPKTHAVTGGVRRQLRGFPPGRVARTDGEEPARADHAGAGRRRRRARSRSTMRTCTGTATESNDRVETRGCRNWLWAHAPRKIPTSALKSQIGHPQGASGAAGVAATLVAMKHETAPADHQPGDARSGNATSDYVPDVGRKASIDCAVCNCVGFGSKNSALLLRKVS